MAIEVKINDTTLSLIKGDITKENTDAIVNAANSRLSGGEGVDGAIHAAAGPEIMEECAAIESCSPGSAVLTSAGKLKAKKIIHTVGPIYKDGWHREAELLTEAYKTSLRLAAKNGLKSVAFPSISTGAYGYPIKEASLIALMTVTDGIRKYKGAFTLIRFVLYSDFDYQVYEESLKEVLT
ncbi:MAG: O-acetyl-ADP-ribose deacetylase [Thermodesulfobacteriota bacterium]|nr:MAG: O-acetyl-ADP-ribose deacetylase [Thermodesulfobacteriota bacterium]